MLEKVKAVQLHWAAPPRLHLSSVLLNRARKIQSALVGSPLTCTETEAGATMQPFDVIALLVTLTALFSYINHRHIRLHPTVGVMLIALLFSLALMILGKFGLGVRHMAAGILDHVEFGDVLLRWMLGFLLFAGAMGVDLGELSRRAGITAWHSSRTGRWSSGDTVRMARGRHPAV